MLVKIGSYSIHFSLTSANWCGDSDPVQDPARTYFDADPDFYLTRIQVTKMMWILADPDPQHWCPTEEVENLDGEAGVLAVLDELAEVWEAVLLGLRILLNDGNDGVRDARLVVQPALVPTIIWTC